MTSLFPAVPSLSDNIFEAILFPKWYCHVLLLDFLTILVSNACLFVFLTHFQMRKICPIVHTGDSFLIYRNGPSSWHPFQILNFSLICPLPSIPLTPTYLRPPSPTPQIWGGVYKPPSPQMSEDEPKHREVQQHVQVQITDRVSVNVCCD